MVRGRLLRAATATAVLLLLGAAGALIGFREDDRSATGPDVSSAAAPDVSSPLATVVAPPSSSPGGDVPTDFSLLFRTSRGDVAVRVTPFTATVHPDGTAEPIDPPHRNAREWAAASWIRQSAYPSATPKATSYIYGHACHYHVCPFTRLRDAAVNSDITVTTSSGRLTYRVCARGLSAKTGNLVTPDCARVRPDLVLVTCQYEHGDISVNNLVVAATLVRSAPAA